jgi:hypothetical protein
MGEHFFIVIDGRPIVVEFNTLVSRQDNSVVKYI